MEKIDSVSIVIPVAERGNDLLNVFANYWYSILALDLNFEIIIVLTPEFDPLANDLIEKFPDQPNLKFILLNRNYGEAGLIKIGVNHAKYDYILTLPPYEQILPSAISRVINELGENDVIVVNRSPRIDHYLNRFQSSVFRNILKVFSYKVPKDAGCGIRFSRKEVFDEVKLYGDLHRFFLILADEAGFKTAEIDIPQSKLDTHSRVYDLRTYLSRALDILTITFLTRFNKKPLRFFGAGGAISTFIGILGIGYIGIERLFFDVGLADRPLLVLFSLFLVLGIQLIAIGLVGETIIFTNSDTKEYRIRKIIN